MLPSKPPSKWQIVATTNPDNGDYSFTPMHDAMLTRMMHLTLNFDAKIWAEWAQATGIDPRGIDFVLTYHEAVTVKRNTPISLDQFFDQISHVPDLSADADLVLAKSTLDNNTVSAFIGFVQDDLARPFVYKNKHTAIGNLALKMEHYQTHNPSKLLRKSVLPWDQ